MANFSPDSGMPFEKLNIREMRSNDVSSIVNIHLKSFPKFFLSFLGPYFLKHLYRGIVTCPLGFGFVAVSDSEGIQGFVAGAENLGAFYTWLIKKRLVQFGTACIRPVLAKPRIIPRLLRVFKSRKSDEIVHIPNAATLMSIGVEPGLQSRGIGKRLVNQFCRETVSRGLSHVELVTDAVNNEAVNAFYVKNGFVCIESILTPDKRLMNRYAKTVE